jgi:hypothetical protein
LPRAAAHPAEPSRECLKHATVTKPDSILNPAHSQHHSNRAWLCLRTIPLIL